LIGQIGQIHIDDMKLIQFALLLSHIGRILATTDSGEVSWFPANGSFKSFHPKAPPFAATKDEELDKLYGVMKDAFTKIIPDSTITDFKANVVLMGLEKDQFGKVMELFKKEQGGGYLTYPKNLGLMTSAVEWEPRAEAAGAAVPVPKYTPIEVLQASRSTRSLAKGKLGGLDLLQASKPPGSPSAVPMPASTAEKGEPGGEGEAEEEGAAEEREESPAPAGPPEAPAPSSEPPAPLDKKAVEIDQKAAEGQKAAEMAESAAGKAKETAAAIDEKTAEGQGAAEMAESAAGKAKETAAEIDQPAAGGQ